MRPLQLLVLACLGWAPHVLAGCQLIMVDFCRGAGYNFTTMPNLVGHETQADAEFTLQTFSPLVQYGCSAQLGFFLCSVYVPMCNEKVASPIGPCRGLCEAVRARCYPVLQGFGFPWPAALDCAKFPAQNDHRHMCMEGPGEAGLGVPPARPAAGPKSYPRPVEGDADCSQLARPSMYLRTNRSGRCLQRCDADVLFTRADKQDAEVWIAVLSTMCFISSLLAAVTLLTDGARDTDWPLSFLALGHAMVSAGWGLRAVLGREAVACYPAPSQPSTLLLAQAGLGNAHCALIFFLTYYFGNAIAVWWLVLVSCWLLRWSDNPSLPHAPMVHLLGWGLPACLTIAVLILRYVDSDELTGICSVGNHNPQSLLALVIMPQFVCLVLGVSMMMLNFISQAGPWSSHRVLLCLLYVVPTSASLATYWYQYWGYEDWVLAMAPSPTPRRQPHPLLWVFLTRCLLNLATGTAVSLWICLPHSPQACWRLLCPAQTHKKPVLTPVKCDPKGFYYYPQAGLHRPQVHRSHRKHKGKNGNETLV